MVTYRPVAAQRGLKSLSDTYQGAWSTRVGQILSWSKYGPLARRAIDEPVRFRNNLENLNQNLVFADFLTLLQKGQLIQLAVFGRMVF